MNVTKRVFVLDSYAILCYLNREAGYKRVIDLLTLAREGKARILLCTINLGEILYIIERRLGLVNALRSPSIAREPTNRGNLARPLAHP